MVSGERKKDGNDKLPGCVLAGEDGQALVVGAERKHRRASRRELAGFERTGHTNLGNIGQPLRRHTSLERSRRPAGERLTLELLVGLVWSGWLGMEGAA